MSAETGTEQQDFLQGLVGYMNEHKKFSGSAGKLVEVLELNITPRSLSVELKKLNGKLENLGIFVSWDRKRDERTITISNNAVVSQNEIILRRIEKTTTRNNGFASHTKKEPITFPFSWLYADIVELPEEEKNEINKVRHHGRKHYQKTCAICGKEGNLQFRKTSDGNSSCLICNPCAEKYVNSAIKLQLNGVGEM